MYVFILYKFIFLCSVLCNWFVKTVRYCSTRRHPKMTHWTLFHVAHADVELPKGSHLKLPARAMREISKGEKESCWFFGLKI